MTTKPNTRVRGLYTTALTQLLTDADVPVVEPSAPVEERFEATFPDALPDVTISATGDSQGIQVQGDPDGVAEVAAIVSDVSADTFRWDAELELGAIFVGRVERTGESGAIVELDGSSGFLPYGESTDYLDSDDRVIAQVIDPEPPWSTRRRTVVSPIPRAPGTYLALVAEDGELTAPTAELRGLVDLLDPDLPRGWRIDVQPTAENAGLATLEAELDRLTEIARQIDETVEEAESIVDDQRRVAGMFGTTWCRFGRAGRFRLDEHRRAITATIEGHHRLKAGGASQTVDFIERLCEDMPSFDSDAVIDTFGPETGDRIRIEHCKPSGNAVTLGRGTVTDRPQSGAVIVRRELSGGGRLDALDVPKEEGDVAETTFLEGRRWYPTVYRDAEENWKGTYVNVCTPLEIYPDAIRYVDLYVDVVKDAEGTVRLVDEEELADATASGLLSKSLATEAIQVASALEESFG